ncbi:MAG: DUF1385 domain-containing protein [Lachnospiraceae bacterium]|nr:DUF1385 domain-containing protein [Lachnospiraceae bacterium]
MKNSKIGGQAVIEGVMMKNSNKYAVAVRKPDNEIAVEVFDVKNPHESLSRIPLVRGVMAFVDSLSIGMKSLTFSSSFFEEEEKNPKNEKKEKISNFFVIAVSILIALGIFMAIPYLVSRFMGKWIESNLLLSIVEGLIRLVFFFAYIVLISRLEDIRRVFAYHGAEHKCINCIEHGMELTVENVRKSSRFHKRCGTSFLFIVMIISMIFYCFINVESQYLQFLIRLLLIPVIAGVSYEFLRFAGNADTKLIEVLSKPGLWLQHLTTKEPDDKMIEVGIKSVEAVFDWRSFVNDLS